MGRERTESYNALVGTLRGKFGNRIFIMPTSDAMVRAAKLQIQGRLPGVEGLHRVVGGKERSLWRDTLGHLGPGFERLEGYVFYATLYGRSPELIKADMDFKDGGVFPGRELDHIFRKIAWQAVIHHPLSGVDGADGDGIADSN